MGRLLPSRARALARPAPSRNSAPGWPTAIVAPFHADQSGIRSEIAFAGGVVEGRRRGQAGRVDVLERAEDPQVAEIGDARGDLEVPGPIAARERARGVHADVAEE